MDFDTLHRVREGLVYLVALVLSICVHEFGHAFVADKLGDRLPRAQGRVTLNPLAHIDPIGTLLLPAIAFFAGGAIGGRIMGWGKPVQISLSARQLTRKISLGTAHALVAVAGPAMNILFGLVLSVVYVALIKTRTGVAMTPAVETVIEMNVMLCLFNLLPIPPLDGGAVLARFVPRRFHGALDNLNRYGFIILFAIIMIPFRGTTLLGWILWPAQLIGESWTGALRTWVS